MRKKGYFGIGCINMKATHNYGTLFRTAQIMEADFLFFIGKKFIKQRSDTMKSWRHLPVFEFENFLDFKNHLPFNCDLIGIEITENAIPIVEFKHPKQGCYILGAEDSGLPLDVIEKCTKIVKLPGERSLNLAVAGSIVLFDRIQKAGKNS